MWTFRHFIYLLSILIDVAKVVELVTESRFVSHCSNSYEMVSIVGPFMTMNVSSGLRCSTQCIQHQRCLLYTVMKVPFSSVYLCQLYDVIYPECVPHRGYSTYRKKGRDQCPDSYLYVASMAACYKIEKVDTPEPSIAYGLCSQHGSSVHLVAIETQEEQIFLTNMLASVGMDYYWTSGMSHHPTQDSSILSSWYWTMSDGTKYPMTYMNWKGTEPNNKEGRGEIYALLRGPEFEWIDIAYSYSSGWSICEYNIYV